MRAPRVRDCALSAHAQRTLSSHRARAREYAARVARGGETLLAIAEREGVAPCLLVRRAARAAGRLSLSPARCRRALCWPSSSLTARWLQVRLLFALAATAG